MSTTDDSGLEPEQQTPPTNADGLAFEIDRSVLGTGRRTDFAQHRAKAMQMKQDAFAYANDARATKQWVLACHWLEIEHAFGTILRLIADRSNAKDETQREVGH